MKYATVSMGYSPRIIFFGTFEQAADDAERQAKTGATAHVVRIIDTCRPMPHEIEWASGDRHCLSGAGATNDVIQQIVPEGGEA